MLDRTKRLTTAVALLTSLLVSLPTAQGQANANEMQTKIETIVTVKSTVSIAKQYIGTPYCRGGKNPRCFDCSGFTQYVYNQQGIKLPSTAQGQYRIATKVANSKAKPGDLVFFITKNGYVYHVAIYVGNGKVIHSPKHGHRVRIESIWTSNVRYGRI
jgi:cell wall-associated NlpC family hydrolase